MAVTINVIEDVVVGEYGQPIIIQLVDTDNAAVDISAYTTSITITANSPFDLKVKTFTGSFVTSGTDGKIQFTPASNNTFDREGTWQAQVKLASASALQMTVVFEIKVEKRLG